MNTAELRDARARLLHRLAELSDGSTSAAFLLDDLGTDVGLDRRQAKRAFLRLREEGLVALAGPGPRVAITHAGLRVIEDGACAAAEAAHMQVNVMYVWRMENSQVQQGTTHSRQIRMRPA